MAAKFVLHVYEPTDGTGEVTMQLDDHWFRIPPNEPYEMAQDSNGRILDYPDYYTQALLGTYGGIYGLVEVEQTKTRTGINLDYDKAIAEAENKLLTNRYRHINLWAQDQMQDRVKQNLPVLPPSGFVEESIKVLNMDIFAKFRFQPVGWTWRPDPNRPIDGAPVVVAAPESQDVVAMREENANLKGRLEAIEGMLGELLAKRNKN